MHILSEVDRFMSNQTKEIISLFHTYRQMHFTSGNALFL